MKNQGNVKVTRKEYGFEKRARLVKTFKDLKDEGKYFDLILLGFEIFFSKIKFVIFGLLLFCMMFSSILNKVVTDPVNSQTGISQSNPNHYQEPVVLDASNMTYDEMYQEALDSLDSNPSSATLSNEDRDTCAKMIVQDKYGVSSPN